MTSAYPASHILILYHHVLQTILLSPRQTHTPIPMRKSQKKWGGWSQWEEMVVEGEISPPGLGRFRGYMGPKLWRLKNPRRKYYSTPITQQRWSANRRVRIGSLKERGKENFVQEVLMGTTEAEPLNLSLRRHLVRSHEVAGLPKVDEPVGFKRPIHAEFNEGARAGREQTR
ncbi:hypothetical protein BGX38DRAFT_1268446 [Terfezia claveryi]|nr:hypothetical protein BGX38DRAFT_1268446 [Terfezia claveryi]